MWKKDDIVLHGNDGVCRISGIQKLNLFGDGLREYYILESLYARNTTIYVEVGTGDASLEPPLSQPEIDDLIRAIPSMTCEWIPNDKLRQQTLGARIRTGSISDLLAMVSMLLSKKEEIVKTGRKFRAQDEKVLDKAQQIINREIAFGLGVQPEKVPAYISSMLEA